MDLYKRKEFVLANNGTEILFKRKHNYFDVHLNDKAETPIGKFVKNEQGNWTLQKTGPWYDDEGNKDIFDAMQHNINNGIKLEISSFRWKCRKCGTPLGDHTDRAYGIGPSCKKKHQKIMRQAGNYLYRLRAAALGITKEVDEIDRQIRELQKKKASLEEEKQENMTKIERLEEVGEDTTADIFVELNLQ